MEANLNRPACAYELVARGALLKNPLAGKSRGLGDFLGRYG